MLNTIRSATLAATLIAIPATFALAAGVSAGGAAAGGAGIGSTGSVGTSTNGNVGVQTGGMTQPYASAPTTNSNANGALSAGANSNLNGTAAGLNATGRASGSASR